MIRAGSLGRSQGNVRFFAPLARARGLICLKAGRMRRLSKGEYPVSLSLFFGFLVTCTYLICELNSSLRQLRVLTTLQIPLRFIPCIGRLLPLEAANNLK